MKTSLSQEFAFPLDLVIAARHLKLYNVTEHDAIKHIEYLSIEETPDKVVTRKTMHLQVPDSMSKFIKPEMAECVEETTWDKKKNEAIFNILPKQMGKMLTWKGFVRYKTHPSDNDKTIRECGTDATCSVPLMGSNVEKSIVKGYEKAMTKELDHMLKIIDLIEKGELKRPF